MSDSESSLGRKPDPEIEPGEPNPGGADKISFADGVDTDEAEGAPTAHDLDPDSNPAVEDALPDEMKQGEDTDTKATKTDEDAGDEDVPPEEDAPA